MNSRSRNHSSDPGTGTPRGYSKPTLERIGSFRELTQNDSSGFWDFLRWFLRHRPNPCTMTGSSTYTCRSTW
jgi:hypothetical protein